MGGSTFEKYYSQGKLEDFRKAMEHFGVTMVEVSDGTVDIPIDEKSDIIRMFHPKFKVVAEVGCKDRDVIFEPDEWIAQLKTCLEAGAWKVICEGRESGDAGIYFADCTPREDVVDHIIKHIPLDKIIWEAPTAKNQIWHINRFGPNVNLGNIAPYDVLILESQRVGLRYDTF